MAKDHGLRDCDRAVDVTQRIKLVLFASAEHVILLDGVQGLLFSLQADDVGVGDDALGKLPHRVLEGCGEKQHLTVFGKLPADRVTDLHKIQTFVQRFRQYVGFTPILQIYSAGYLLVYVTHLWMRMLWSW